MKRLLFSICLFASTATVSAQQKTISQAIISTTTNVIVPEDEEPQNNPGGGMNFRNMMDGEMKSTTYLKNDMVKTILKNDMGRSTIIRNNSTKLTTTLLEIMGTKNGFYVTDSEQVEIRRKADSVMHSRRKNDSSISQGTRPEPVTEISYTEETKKIAGYNCKKAFVITTRILDVKDTVVIWYTPDIKFQYISSTGGLSAFGNMGSVSGLEKIDGFVMRYEMNMRRNRKMEVEVTKIDTVKEIADKEFDVPKDFELKPMKEMQNMFGGRGGFNMMRPN